MLVIILTFFALLITFIGFIAHRIRTSRMRKALGRDVTDNEALSLNSWMQVVEKENQQIKK